jgi:hypothetical protein
MKENKCKYCKKLLTENSEHIGGIVVLQDKKMAHGDCARDYWIIKSRENHICD